MYFIDALVKMFGDGPYPDLIDMTEAQKDQLCEAAMTSHDLSPEASACLSESLIADEGLIDALKSDDVKRAILNTVYASLESPIQDKIDEINGVNQ